MNLTKMLMGTNVAKLIANWLLNDEIQVSHVLMPFNNLGDEGLYELARAISSNNTIVAVDFTQNSLTPRCAGALFCMLATNDSIISFSIGSYKGPERNRLGHEGCYAIADAIR